MLLKKSELDAIVACRIQCVYRRWKRATVKTGGSLKTAVGLLAIDKVTAVEHADITTSDAAEAGHESLGSLIALLDKREGNIYRIDLRYAGDDPRIALREHDKLSADELDAVVTQLGRLDKASRTGAWTHDVLRLIGDHPHRAAAELARLSGREKDWLKTNVRKLKDRGLTISHHPGYELSPRGIAVVAHLGARPSRR